MGAVLPTGCGTVPILLQTGWGYSVDGPEKEKCEEADGGRPLLRLRWPVLGTSESRIQGRRCRRNRPEGAGNVSAQPSSRRAVRGRYPQGRSEGIARGGRAEA